MNEIFIHLIINEIFSIFRSIFRSFEITKSVRNVRFERPSFVENEKVMGERGWSRVPSQMGAGWQPVERRGAHPRRKSGGESWQMTMRWRCRLVREMSNDRRNRDHSSSIVGSIIDYDSHPSRDRSEELGARPEFIRLPLVRRLSIHTLLPSYTWSALGTILDDWLAC